MGRATVAAALVLAGCSGGGETPETPPAEPVAAGTTVPSIPAATSWAARAEGICTVYHSLLETVSQPTTADDVPRLLHRKVDLTRSAARQFRATRPPPPRRQAARQLAAALDRRAIALEQLAVAEGEHDDRAAQISIQAGLRSDAAARRWSDVLGLVTCGRKLFESDSPE